jgi:hypothetical protein
VTGQLRSDVEAYIEKMAAGGYDVPRRTVVADLRAILAAVPDHESVTAGAPALPLPVPGTTEYAILSFRDGLEPVDSLDDAEEQMRMFWRKPGRARILHRQAYATEWAALYPEADGPALAAA